MKKRTIRILSTLLVLALSAGLFACAGDSGKKSEETTAEEPQETIAWLDHLPDDLYYDGRTIRVCGGSFVVDSADTKEVVSKARYDRYVNVTERLGIEITQTAVDREQTAVELREMMDAGLDEYDCIMNYGLPTLALALEGYIYDMAKDPEFDLIDLDAEYWAKEFTNDINIGEYKFWVFGEACSDLESQIYVIYVNNSLLCQVLSDELESEDAKSPIYDTVRNGAWTLDELIRIVRKAYKDDGDGAVSENDRFGFGEQADNFIDTVAFSAGATYSKRDEFNIPVPNLSTETNVSINEKLYDLLQLDGALHGYVGTGTFTAGNLVFFAECSDLSGSMRDMKDDWTMIPMPKLDENIENYTTTVHYTFKPYGIPISAPEDVHEPVYAMLEAFAAEQHRICRPAFFDEALKNKYSRDEDTKEMIDILSQNVKTDFLIAYGYTTGVDKLFCGNCYQTRDISSLLARKDKPLGKSIDKLLEKIESKVD